MMRVAIIDCGAGNLHSVRKAFATQLPQGAVLEIVTDAAALAQATHIVLPGVGAFADCMQGLNVLPGMRAALEDAVLTRGVPFFGICVGMQMLFERGHEFGVHEGLGWFKGEVAKLAPADANLRIPHMGWNRLQLSQKALSLEGGGLGGGHDGAAGLNYPSMLQRPDPHLTSPFQGEGHLVHPVLKSIQDGDFVYFVHSYAAIGCNAAEMLATVDYGGPVVALIGRKNIVASQFHPEKSQAVGLRLIRNFLEM